MKLTFLFFLFLTVSLTAQNKSAADLFLYDFLPGSYDLTGRLPDCDSLYSGTVQIKQAENGFTVLRYVGKREIKGTGYLGKAAAGDATVLRVRFEENGKGYEITYLIQADLDNYARLSGYLYRTDGTTKKAGLETLFHIRR